MVHQHAEQLKLYHKTTGIRYKILTISVHPIEKKIETNRQIVARQLRSASAISIPADEHVSAVINDTSNLKKKRGRPKKF